MNETNDASPRVLVVAVTHNGGEWLPICLRGIAQQDYSDFDVIVVDSASDARVERVVLGTLPEAEVVRLDQNIGFGAAANHALESSERAPGADYYLFLHDDVVMQSECLGLMVEAALEAEAGIVGGKGLSWEQPNLLLEVGMSADQLGFPYPGLEPGEIDQGQHDTRREVLFVTNACILVSRAVIERVGSWDGAYFAFGEDLDLCLRGRLAGFKTIVEPGARFGHAVALATGKRPTEEESIRFLTRRNRLRTIVKTAAAYRLWAVLLLYGVVIASEMVLLASLRRFDELRAYPRAFWSFFLSIPEIFRRRRAVQKRRAVPDRRIRRLMVSDLHRARVFAERRLREWEVGTIRFGEKTFARLQPSALRAAFVSWITRPATLRVAVVVVLMVFAARNILFGGEVAAGGIWPFPEPNRALLTDFFAPWRDIGLGTSSAPPPSLLLLWLAGAFSFGSPGFAQFLLIASLLLTGLYGMYRLMSLRTARVTARAVALAVYALGPVLELVIEGADLSSLALFAGLPFMFEIGLRMLRPSTSEEGDRPATPLDVDAMVQDAVRLALVGILVVALAPSSLVEILWLWVLVTASSYMTAWERRELLQRAGWLVRSMVATVVLLLPWTIEALRPRGAILAPIFAGRGGGVAYGPLWSRFDFTDMLLLHPYSGVLAAIGVGAVVFGALSLSTPSRRRESRLLVTILMGFAAIGGLVAHGWFPAPVASPTMWMMIPLAATAVLAGHFAAGISEELPRHAVGIRHAITFVVVAAAVLGLGWAWGSRLADWHAPLSTLAGPVEEESAALGSFFSTTAETKGDFRILWLGSTWKDPIRSALRSEFFITGPEGLSNRDLIEPPGSEGEKQLEEVIEAVGGGRLDHAGHLMAPMGIAYVVVSPHDSVLMGSMQRQRDFKLEQSEIAVFSNLAWLPRAVLTPAGLDGAAASGEQDPTALMLADWRGGKAILARSQSSFRGELGKTRHSSIILADNHNDGWRATVGDQRLDHDRAFGWANRFDVPRDATGRVVSIRFGPRWPRLLWVGLQALALAMAIAMARLRSSRATGSLGP